VRASHSAPLPRRRRRAEADALLLAVLIVTEEQLNVYDPQQPIYRVQSYNVSVQVTAAE